MTDIATISLKADTSDLERGTQKLKEFGSAAEKVNSSTEDLNEQFKRGVDTQKKATQAAEKQRKELHELLNQLNPTNKAFEKLDDWQTKLSVASKKGMLPTDQFHDYNNILEQTRDKLQKMHMSLTVEGQALLAQEAATNRAKQAADEFLNSLKSQTDTLGKTRTEILELKAAQMGVTQQAAPMIAKLKDQEKAFLNGSITIGQYKQAMRQLPMQMTDVVTSLASGMPVWLVMIQQGGQIKDSFGGIGNSLKAMASLITPTKIAMVGLAGAASAVAIAAYKGSMEFGEYNRQLILTGGYAGKTASQLDMLSRQLSGNGITQYRMADALSKVVGSGLFTGNAVEMIANTAAKMEEATGQSIDETIKQFSRLKNEPVSAILELNKTMHFLKSSELERIMRLEEMGHKDQAAAESMALLSKASLDMANKVKANLGTLESAWKAVSDAAKDAWDQMLSVGREVPLHERLNQKTKQLEIAVKELEQAEKSIVPDTSGYGYGRQSESFMNQNATRNLEARRTLVQNLRKDVSDLQKQVETEDSAAAQADKAQKREEKRIASLEYRKKSVNEWVTNEKKRSLELADLWRKVADAPDLWSREDREAAVKNINKKYKPEATKKGKEYRPDYGTRADESANEALVSLQSQLKVLKEHKTVADVISAERKKLWDMEAKISVIEEARSTRKLTKDEQALLAKKESVLESQKALAVAGDAVELQKQHNRELDRQLKRVEEINARSRALDMGAGKSDRMYQRDIALEQAKSPAERKALEDYYSKEDSLRANWEAGVKKGFAEFQDQATNVYGNVAQISQSFFQGMSNSVADFVITGKASFGDFTRSFLEMTTKMLMQMAMLNSMKAAFGGTAVGGFLGFAGGGYTGDGGKYDAAGVVHKGEFVFDKDSTAKLGKDNLYRLMDAGKKGYASGGYVGGSQPMSVNQSRVQVYGAQSAVGAQVNISIGDLNFGNNQQQPSSGQINHSAVKRELNQEMEGVVNKLLLNPASALSRAIKGN
ncbi:Phage-related minor tail protein [Providencia alcalifaciens]|nr:Phage-related minor tail protein [Providencia alcalifaciens]